MNTTVITPAALKQHPTITRLTEIQRELGLNDIDFAKQLRFRLHGANWGKILAGTYTGSFSKALIHLEVALDEFENQGLGELDDGVVVLPHVRDALNATEIANAADDEHRLVIVSGVRGAGKTQTLKLIHAKHSGFIGSARPSWSKGYLNFLNKLSNVVGLSDSRSAGEAESKIVSFAQESGRQTLCLGEFNYFSSDALGFIKTMLNETLWTIVCDTIPHHLNRMASSQATSQESAQLLRRGIIISIPPVSVKTVESLQKALFPELDLVGQLSAIVSCSNQFDRIDSVCQILSDCDPERPSDVSKSIERHKRFHLSNLKPQDTP